MAADQYAPKPLYEAAKRLLDVSSALLILMGLSPLWLLVALAIKLTSPGPVLFRDTVVGKGCKPFTYFEFRSMTQDSDDRTHRQFIAGYVANNQTFTTLQDPRTGQEKPVFKVIGDPRVTWIGRLLRRSSLDEIPQLLNVLRGEMSLVGPRPPLAYEYELYDDWAKQRLTLLSGITGLAQVRARSTASFAQMVAMDLEYIRRRSLWLDMAILLRTIPVVALGIGAH